jgi:hypothetical protein
MAVMMQLLLSVFTPADTKRASQVGLQQMMKEKLDQLMKDKDKLGKFREKCADNLRSALEDLKEYLLQNPDMVGQDWYNDEMAPSSPKTTPVKKK